jgi:hypothetical protein
MSGSRESRSEASQSAHGTVHQNGIGASLIIMTLDTASEEPIGKRIEIVGIDMV